MIIIINLNKDLLEKVAKKEKGLKDLTCEQLVPSKIA